MKRILLFALLLLCLDAAAVSPERVVPGVRDAELLKGSLRVSGIPFKCDPAIGPAGRKAAARLAADLSMACGKTSTVTSPIGLAASVGSGSAKGIIFLHADGMQPGEYHISIGSRCAVVSASSDEGIVHSAQTLRQLLPESIYGAADGEKARWVLPCCEIHDGPRMAYRGLMLDCSRHFWSTAEIRRCLDLMEAFKLNSFVWHLSDDQGWRMETDTFPQLNSIGSWREGTATSDGSSDHERYGGFYSKDEIREIIRYAEERGITVIPEISLAGHVMAALAACPGIGCTGGPYEAATGWGTFDELICPGKQQSYEFVQTVLGEAAALFPSEYVHIGAADCPTTRLEACPDCQAKIGGLGLHDRPGSTAEQQLLGHFVGQMAGMLASAGKKAVCMEDVLDWMTAEQLLESGITVICDDAARGASAAAQGIPVIFTSAPAEGTAALGIQEDVWTESISTPEQLERRLEDTLPQLSEKQWRASSYPEKISNLDNHKTE